MDYVILKVKGNEQLAKLMNILSCLERVHIFLIKNNGQRIAHVEHRSYLYTFKVDNDTLIIEHEDENVKLQLKLNLSNANYLCLKINTILEKFYRLIYKYEVIEYERERDDDEDE